MKIAVIGPSNIDRVAVAAGADPSRIRQAAVEAGRYLAGRGHDIVVVPDYGVAVIAAQAYREAEGNKVWGLIPTSGKSAEGASGRVQRNIPLCDEVDESISWHEQHSQLVETADALVCIGLSCGTLCEIAWTKWAKKIPVYVLLGLGSRVPPEMEAETQIRYIKSVSELPL